MTDFMLEKIDRQFEALRRRMEADTETLLRAIQEWGESNRRLMAEIDSLNERVAVLESKSEKLEIDTTQRVRPALVN